MTEKEPPSALDLHATLERMEPGCAPAGIEMAAVSIAISLKRIADALPKMDATLYDIRYAISQVSNNGQSIAPAINTLKSDIANVANAISGLHGTINNIRVDNIARRAVSG